jgi:hypothetical protein
VFEFFHRNCSDWNCPERWSQWGHLTQWRGSCSLSLLCQFNKPPKQKVWNIFFPSATFIPPHDRQVNNSQRPHPACEGFHYLQNIENFKKVESGQEIHFTGIIFELRSELFVRWPWEYFCANNPIFIFLWLFLYSLEVAVNKIMHIRWIVWTTLILFHEAFQLEILY